MMINDFKLGVSMAASWAWGVTIGVSFSILTTKGVVPFLIWGIANCMAILVFGLYVRKYPNYLNFAQNKCVKIAMVIIQVFSVWVNVKIMADFTNSYIATAIALTIILLTLKYKFDFSVGSDQWQYAWMIVGLIIVVLTGNQNTRAIFYGNNIPWALWGALALLAGPFLDGQQFQRAKVAKSLRPFIIGSVAFTVYLSLVFVAYFYNSNNVIMATIVIAVATSTLDSCVAAKQYLVGDKWAWILSLLALATWPIFLNKHSVFIWSLYASGRVFVVIPLIITGWWSYGRVKQRKI